MRKIIETLKSDMISWPGRLTRGLRNKLLLVALLFAVIALATPSKCFSTGLEVGPGDIYLDNLPLGQLVAVSIFSQERKKLGIKNKGAVACTYEVNILPCAQTTATLNPGYLDIPDTAWIYAKEKEILVAGNSSKEIELYLNIPKQQACANKKYQAVIEVKSKKNRADELFVLACQLKIFFSTAGMQAGEGKDASK